MAGYAVVGVGLRAVVDLWIRQRNADEALQRVQALGRDPRADDARELVHIAPGSVAAVVFAGFAASSQAAAEEAIAATMEDELNRFRSRVRAVDWAGGSAVAAPVLFGVWLLADGRADFSLQGWLFLASLGLAIAIAATLGRFWLLSRLRRLAIDMEKGAAVVYNTAR